MDLKEKYEANNKRIRKDRRNRLKDKISEFIFYFWMFILCVILFLFYATVQAVGWKNIIFPVSLLVIWIVITAIFFIVQQRKSIFVKKKVFEEVVIEDLRFGTLKCMKEKNNNDSDLKCDTLNLYFGKYNPEIEIKNYKEENRELYFSGLAYVYDIQNEIISNLYKEATDCCTNWEECDENGNPITYEYVRDNFYIGSMIIEINDGDVMVIIRGWPGDGLLGEHDIGAYINCTKKTVDYTLEG